MADGGSLVTGGRATEATYWTTVVADQLLWWLPLSENRIEREREREVVLTVWEEVMSTRQMAPAASCAYQRVGVSGSALRASVFRMTSCPTW